MKPTVTKIVRQGITLDVETLRDILGAIPKQNPTEVVEDIEKTITHGNDQRIGSIKILNLIKTKLRFSMMIDEVIDAIAEAEVEEAMKGEEE